MVHNSIQNLSEPLRADNPVFDPILLRTIQPQQVDYGRS
jgi:hypothetical protein